MTTTGIKCPGCGEFHTEGHYDTCACDHCQPPDDGPPTAVILPATRKHEWITNPANPLGQSICRVCKCSTSSSIGMAGQCPGEAPTAVVPMVVMPRELAERCLFQAKARGTFLKSSVFARAAERTENAAVQSDLQDLLARE